MGIPNTSVSLIGDFNFSLIVSNFLVYFFLFFSLSFFSISCSFFSLGRCPSQITFILAKYVTHYPIFQYSLQNYSDYLWLSRRSHIPKNAKNMPCVLALGVPGLSLFKNPYQKEKQAKQQCYTKTYF